MDGDPSVEPEVDSFSLVLPLPYRVAIILVCGIWAWGLNLQYLYLVKIVGLPLLYLISVLTFPGCTSLNPLPISTLASP